MLPVHSLSYGQGDRHLLSHFLSSPRVGLSPLLSRLLCISPRAGQSYSFFATCCLSLRAGLSHLFDIAFLSLIKGRAIAFWGTNSLGSHRWGVLPLESPWGTGHWRVLARSWRGHRTVFGLGGAVVARSCPVPLWCQISVFPGTAGPGASTGTKWPHSAGSFLG